MSSGDEQTTDVKDKEPVLRRTRSGRAAAAAAAAYKPGPACKKLPAKKAIIRLKRTTRSVPDIVEETNKQVATEESATAPENGVQPETIVEEPETPAVKPDNVQEKAAVEEKVNDKKVESNDNKETQENNEKEVQKNDNHNEKQDNLLDGQIENVQKHDAEQQNKQATENQDGETVENQDEQINDDQEELLLEENQEEQLLDQNQEEKLDENQEEQFDENQEEQLSEENQEEQLLEYNQHEQQLDENQEEQLDENQEEQLLEENQEEQLLEENQEEQIEENLEEQTEENLEEQTEENLEEQTEENLEEQTEENLEEQIEENLEEQMEENQDELAIDNDDQIIINHDDDLNECDEEMLEGDVLPSHDDAIETDNIPEFDPDEMNDDENITENVVDEGISENVNENENETEVSAPMEVDDEQLSAVSTATLKVKDTTDLLDIGDDQCILIEDDTDQHLLEETSEQTSPVDSKIEKSQIKYSTQDSEVIPDDEKFQNEDVEFISEGDLDHFNQKETNQINNLDEAQEVIEISDHESDTAPKKNEPDTEAVSEDELPTETTAKEPETEAVSDDELPVAQRADLGETESVSEDELPIESEKKKKGGKAARKIEKKSKIDKTSKRKRTAEGEYDPSSPTSENNDETPSKKKAIAADSAKSDAKPASPKKKILPELEKYWKAVNEDPADFTGWTYLLQYVDQENDAEAAREAYNKFLERYPYCYGYWRKYADYEKKKGDPERVQTVFDQGLKAISLSVDLWLHYINHCKASYEKDEEKLRSQYERAIKACGLEFRSDRLWESYIKWETENKRYNRVMNVYDRLLTTPTLGYMTHFETFQEFVTNNSPNRILSVDDFLALRAEVKTILKSDDPAAGSDDAPPGEDLPPNETPPSDEETRAIREKIISSRRKMHKNNVNAVAARWTFEEGIKRPYFHVKPLERCQLKNWKEYLDYEIDQKDQTRIIILFERCLIACALYDEFWMRFVRYMESLKGDNAEKIRDVYIRACKVHHPKKPNLHLQWATFEESMGNFDKAAAILENIDSIIPNMLQIAYRRINLERRRGDLDKTCSLYEHYISSSKNRTISNNIVVKYARFLCKIKNDTDKAVKVLLKATEKDRDNPRLYLQLIDIGLQRNPIDAQEVISYMDLFIDREHADVEQRVLFAQRKVEFLEDFSTDIGQVLKAHEQFQKCIKQAKDRKKMKTEDKADATPPKKPKIDTSTAPPAQVGSQSYQYSSNTAAPYQSQQQQQFQSNQYNSQGGYQQGYQQYPPPSDPNYANYQNWQYSQSGPQAYTPYNQWGSYNYY